MTTIETYAADIFACPPFQMVDAHDCHRAFNIRVQRSFEPMSMQIWCDMAHHATAIVDIGAQVGVYSLAAASIRKDVPIHAFEPNPDAYARLALHRRINGFDNLHCHRDALANFTGITSISWVVKGELISSGGHIGNSPGGGLGESFGHVSVPCIADRLDRYGFSLGDRGLIKIDVEGAEGLVLQGMSETLAQKPTIILETFSAPACAAWNAAIKPLGYKVCKIFERDGDMMEMPELMPCDKRSGDFNHLLYVEQK